LTPPYKRYLLATQQHRAVSCGHNALWTGTVPCAMRVSPELGLYWKWNRRKMRR